MRDNHKIPQALVDLELSSILRTRVQRALRDSDADRAAEALRELEQMADSSPDENVHLAQHGATGAMLVAKGKYAEAIAHLEEDDRNPLSMATLAQAYEKFGAKDKAQRMTARLAALNEPTIEQAVVVPSLRKSSSTAAAYKPR